MLKLCTPYGVASLTGDQVASLTGDQVASLTGGQAVKQCFN